MEHKATPNQTDTRNPRDFWKLGQRVRLTEDIDRYPHGLYKAGETGTVVQVGSRKDEIWLGVELDNHHDALWEWKNVLYWYLDFNEWPQVEACVCEQVDAARSDTLEAVTALSDLMGLYGGEPASDDEETLEVWEAAQAVVAKHMPKSQEGREQRALAMISKLMYNAADAEDCFSGLIRIQKMFPDLLTEAGRANKPK